MAERPGGGASEAGGARRWVPTATMMFLSLLSYLDRNVLSQLAPTILADTHLTGQDYGFVMSAFSIAYCAGNLVWGRVIDRHGVRVGAAAAVAMWTVASASHAFAGSLAGFALARLVLGFGEGATFPAGLRTAIQTLDRARRARGVALAYSGGSLGALMTPLLVTPIAVRWGWRAAFVCTGLLGASWLAAWGAVSRRQDLDPSSLADDESASPPADRSLWGFGAAYALGALPLGFVLNYAALYLGRGLGYSQALLGYVLWLPPLGWEVGYFFWGWVLDHARGQDRFGRLFRLLAALGLPFVATPFVPSLAGMMALMFWAMFVSAGFVIVSLGEITDRHPQRHAGYLGGFGAGSWAVLMFVAHPLFGRMLDQHRYVLCYAVSTAGPLVGLLAWTILSPRRRSHAPSAVLS